MSQICPLCGKKKAEEALFCDACTKTIKSEYEITVPEATPSEAEFNETAPDAAFPLSDSEIRQEDPVYIRPQRPRRAKKAFLWIVVLAVIGTLAFFGYRYITRQGNLERTAWETAVKENTVESFLAYMETHPQGIHYEEAQQNLLKRKGEEATAWETMKASDNTAALRDFVRDYPKSPYNTLVKIRLDSLTWEGTLRENTAEAYSNYMVLSESGDFNGDYYAEAQKRYAMLFQSYPVDKAVLDSIQATVDGIFTAWSTANYAAITPFLAPSVSRFFDIGSAKREKITGQLSMEMAKSENAPRKLVPDIEAIQYEKTLDDRYKVNVPLVKTIGKDPDVKEIPGYIVHIELDSAFLVTAIYETKPYTYAP
ncbi:MAG TPA: hypothetical protein DDZ96_05915 [Porphyromonadaceae bacterium]|jgi:hypothetical protein|uniref:hypothetical protein n=1 Tax=Limibacterium fermenti TaxID=3229863 RepID=UPI000E8AD6BA|nr:hypothetical protein [Porphyromonadaceae bacterium]HBL33343.1 hypothetical protein [Porphyromonadaceae bacterium]HBX44833.1 hypothetical protein [Porphyromonadaceae bacterium]